MLKGVASSEDAKEIQDPFGPKRSLPLTESQEGEAFAADVAAFVLKGDSRGPSPSPLSWQAPVVTGAQKTEENPVQILITKGLAGLQDAIECHRWKTSLNPTIQEIKRWAEEAKLQLQPEDMHYLETNSSLVRKKP